MSRPNREAKDDRKYVLKITLQKILQTRRHARSRTVYRINRFPRFSVSTNTKLLSRAGFYIAKH